MSTVAFQLLDGFARNRDSRGFRLPSLNDITRLKIGSVVKMGFELEPGLSFDWDDSDTIVKGEQGAWSERFWVTITAIDNGKYTAEINNPLIHAEVWGVDLDDLIHFEIQNIIAIERS
jgi:hypothetical protein